MERKQGWMWMLAGVILAMVAAMIVYRMLSSAVQAAASVPQVETQPVVVAVEDIPLRTIIEETMVSIREIPVDLVPSDAVLDVQEVVGKMALTDLKAGEIILRSRLESPTNITRNIALTIPEGQVVIALPANDLLSRVGMIKPGDRVDILFSLDYGQGDNSMITIDALHNVVIQAVVVPPTLEAVEQVQDTTGGGAAAGNEAILIALDPQDALVLKYLIDAGAVLDFALRAPDDDSTPFLEPVDLLYLEDMYGLEIPTAPTAPEEITTP